ncbi:MAG: hypothetical protein Q9183_001975 [Haloplaca sp. 2 TL-2023]
MSLTPEQFQDQWENRHDDRSGDLLAAGIVMLVLPPIAVALRFYCRKTMKVKLSWDDYFIIVAQVLMFGLCSEVMIGSQNGSGRHLVAVGLDTIVTFSKVSAIRTEVILVLTASSAQLVFHLHLPLCHNLRQTLHPLLLQSNIPKRGDQQELEDMLVGSHCLFNRVVGWIVLRHCFPVHTSQVGGKQLSPFASKGLIDVGNSYFWTQAIDPGKGTCLDRPALLWASSVLTLLNDIAILVLPIPILWRLQMPQSKKIGILGIFLLGSFVVLTTIIRLCYINDVIPYDATWTQVDPTIWTLAEPGVAIICACLPVMSPLFRSKWQNIRSTSWFSRSKTSGKGSDPYGSGSGGRRHHFVQMPKKTAMTEEHYSRDKIRDEEMAIPLKEVGTRR